MKSLNTLVFLALLFGAPLAHAKTIIEADTASVPLIYRNRITIRVSGAPALRLFDALKVSATPAWDDARESNKSSAGLYCYDQASGGARNAQCDFNVHAQGGFTDAAPLGHSDIVVALSGAAAGQVYDALAIAETSEDPEGYTYSKTLPGLSCQRHALAKSYDCVIVLDAELGVLR